VELPSAPANAGMQRRSKACVPGQASIRSSDNKTQCPVLCNTKKVVHAVQLVHAMQVVHLVHVDHVARVVGGKLR